jgi:hypothetical protein
MTASCGRRRSSGVRALGARWSCVSFLLFLSSFLFVLVLVLVDDLGKVRAREGDAEVGARGRRRDGRAWATPRWELCVQSSASFSFSFSLMIASV